MMITYLVMKLAFQGVLEECNRLAAEEYSREYVRFLKANLAQLTLDYESGAITREAFERAQREILTELDAPSPETHQEGL